MIQNPQMTLNNDHNVTISSFNPPKHAIGICSKSADITMLIVTVGRPNTTGSGGGQSCCSILVVAS